MGSGGSILKEFWGFGWQVFDLAVIDLFQIRKALTREIGLVTSSELSVRDASESKTNTLSSIHGAGSFPHHTDFAFQPIPPRAILLANPTETDFARPSHFSDLEQLSAEHRETLGRSLWELRVRDSAYLVGSKFNIFQRAGLRWDTEFLRPSNAAARRCESILPVELVALQQSHTWAAQTALLLDNWRFTHARGEPPGEDDRSTRNIIRFEVWQHARLD